MVENTPKEVETTSSTNNTSDSKNEWSIWSFYRKAWKITWKHKKLWVLGFAVAIYASGGSYRSNSFPKNNSQKSTTPTSVSRTQTTPKITTAPAPSPTSTFKPGPVGILNVAPASGENSSDPLSLIVLGITSVPLPFYILFGVEVLAFFIFAIILRFVTMGWAKAALILGVRDAVEKNTVDLTAAAQQALGRIKSMIWVDLVPWLLVLLAVIGGTIATFIVGAVFPPVAILLGIVLTIFGAYVFIRVALASIFAERYVALDKMSGKAAFEKAYAFVKGNLWKTGRLGVANVLTAAIASALAIFFLVILAVVFALPFILTKQVNFYLLAAILPILLLVISVLSILNCVLKVFSYTTWYFALQYVNKKGMDKK